MGSWLAKDTPIKNPFEWAKIKNNHLIYLMGLTKSVVCGRYAAK